MNYPTPYANSPLLPLLLLNLANQKHSPDVKSTFKEEYDYVIVKLKNRKEKRKTKERYVTCNKTYYGFKISKMMK